MTYQENPERKVYNIDFDGTLTTGEYTNDPAPDNTTIKKLKQLYYSGHIIIIWTARQWDNAPHMVSWLTKYSIPYHGIIMAKGGSDCYIDDKAMNIKTFKRAKNL